MATTQTETKGADSFHTSSVLRVTDLVKCRDILEGMYGMFEPRIPERLRERADFYETLSKSIESGNTSLVVLEGCKYVLSKMKIQNQLWVYQELQELENRVTQALEEVKTATTPPLVSFTTTAPGENPAATDEKKDLETP